MESLALSMPTPHAPTSGARLVATGDRALPLRHAHLSAEATAGLCRTVLTQRFVNPYTEPLQVTYLLPLPSDGAVSGFSFTLGETRVVGEVDTRKQARERFEQALATGRTAALLEQDRSSVFTQEVGNVPPGEEIVCEIVIDQPLTWIAEGAWEWRFPTVVGPRYQGAPGRVRDAAKITVDVAEADIGARSSLALSIGDSVRGAIESASHRVKAEDGEVRFEESRLDRDIVVRWPVAAPEPGVTLSSARPASHDGTTFGLLTVVPPEAGAMEAQARDLILLLDTSGSMSGRPLDQVKRVSLALLDSLGDRDRIEIIEFGSSPRRFRSEPIRATRDGKQAARAWLKALKARGGTEMHRAVLEALRPLRDGAQRQVVLMTDGYIGFEHEIIGTLMNALPDGVRLHTVGVGSAPNRSLTEAAARAGNGCELIVGLAEDAERLVARLLVRTSNPLVTDLRIEGATEVAPRRMPDLYAGCPALVSIACEPGSTLTLRGRTARGTFEQRVEVPTMDLGEGAIGVVARFGRQKVEDLEMALSSGAPVHEIDASIEDVGLRFQIATRLTSWIAVTEQRTVDASERRHEKQPHELPHGVSMEGLGLRSASEDEESGVLFNLKELASVSDADDEMPRLAQTMAGVIRPGTFEKMKSEGGAQGRRRKSTKGRAAGAPPPARRPGPARGTGAPPPASAPPHPSAPPPPSASSPAAPPAQAPRPQAPPPRMSPPSEAFDADDDLAAGSGYAEMPADSPADPEPSRLAEKRAVVPKINTRWGWLYVLILALIVALVLAGWWVATR